MPTVTEKEIEKFPTVLNSGFFCGRCWVKSVIAGPDQTNKKKIRIFLFLILQRQKKIWFFLFLIL